MKKMLIVTTSLNGAEGNSSKLAQQFVEQAKQKQSFQITELDLSNENAPHLTAKEMQAWATSPEQRSAEQQELAAISETYVEQLQAADVIVFGVPMYNFGIPSQFKAWIDRVARAGVTFQYTENGPEGLLKNKSVFVMAARGGVYAGTPMDTQTQYLKDVFGFIGLDSVEFAYAEGLAMGDESADAAWKQSNEKIIELIANIVP